MALLLACLRVGNVNDSAKKSTVCSLHFTRLVCILSLVRSLQSTCLRLTLTELTFESGYVLKPETTKRNDRNETTQTSETTESSETKPPKQVKNT